MKLASIARMNPQMMTPMTMKTPLQDATSAAGVIPMLTGSTMRLRMKKVVGHESGLDGPNVPIYL
eukprot:scaffold3593_cov164-Skeletonema_dohrnii-CCMP3373.AAC.2